MELIKNKELFKSVINDDIIIPDEGQPDIPKRIEDIEKINLGNVITSADIRSFNKLLK